MKYRATKSSLILGGKYRKIQEYSELIRSHHKKAISQIRNAEDSIGKNCERVGGQLLIKRLRDVLVNTVCLLHLDSDFNMSSVMRCFRQLGKCEYGLNSKDVKKCLSILRNMLVNRSIKRNSYQLNKVSHPQYY